MKYKRYVAKIITILTSAVMFFSMSMTAYGDNEKTQSVKDKLESFSASSILVSEVTTGKVLFEKNTNEQFYASHFTKLMTLLLTAEALDSGDVLLSDKFLASELAHNQPAPQIWLNKGEKISVDELIKSITVGNANDAAVVLAENISNSCDKFVEMMNSRCKELKMKDTLFTDCTGVDTGNVTTASDLSILCRELLKYKNLTAYMTQWIDNVRNGETELVNSNRLVRTYKGMTGLKACNSIQTGSSICAGATKNGMSVCAVVIGSGDNDKRDSEAKQLLNMCFESYQMYTPEIPKELLEKIDVTGGESLFCELEAKNVSPVVIPRGSASSLEISTEKQKLLTAPVKEGQLCGTLSVRYVDKEICRVEIVAKNNVKKMNWLCAVDKLLYNLLNF